MRAASAKLVPEVGTVIDIGGQDSKAIWLDARGAVRDFAMNDRCAAGTGRFLEVLADRLGVRVEDLGGQAARSTAPTPISSTCVVFAETEIVGLLASNIATHDIAAGVLKAIASRMASMLGRRAALPVVLTGGVARVVGMAERLSEAIGCPVRLSPDPEYTGAWGRRCWRRRGSRARVYQLRSPLAKTGTRSSRLHAADGSFLLEPPTTPSGERAWPRCSDQRARRPARNR
jgi:predicted CoA-substrate-specific enzyme activase